MTFIVQVSRPGVCRASRGNLNKAVTVHLKVFKGFPRLPLFKVSVQQHGQRRSSACQPLNRNSSCSSTISRLLEVSSAAKAEREDGETVSRSLPPPSVSTHLHPFPLSHHFVKVEACRHHPVSELLLVPYYSKRLLELFIRLIHNKDKKCNEYIRNF